MLSILLLCTLGLYAPYWFFRSARILNRIVRTVRPDVRPVSMTVVAGFALLALWSAYSSLSSFDLSVPDLSLALDTDLLVRDMAFGVLKDIGTELAYFALFLGLSLVFRDRFNKLLRAEPASEGALSIVWTFILGIIHLQSRINHDSAGS